MTVKGKRKNLVVGILKEEKNRWEKRAPLTPSDVKWLVDRGIEVEVESSPTRVFKDRDYRAKGAKIVGRAVRSDLLVGIKEPHPEKVLDEKVYMAFSHTVKGQSHNMPLLRKFKEKGVTLIDYEKITDDTGRRLVYFGTYAGICGMVDGLYYLGKRLEWKGIKNPFPKVKPSWKYRSVNGLKKDIKAAYKTIHEKGLDKRLTPFIIGITGHGNASKGAQEILGPLAPIEVHPGDIGRFIRHQRYIKNRIYKIVLFREEKLRARHGKGFYFEEYLEHPEQFESNLDKYLPHFNLLLHASYWDKRYPRLVTKEMIRKLYRKKDFRLQIIVDVSCDMGGSIEITREARSPENPVYTYDPMNDDYADGYKADGVTLLPVDNLPAELPADSSRDFSAMIRDYVYQISAHGVKDVKNHIAIPKEIRRAVITQDRRLAEGYEYLNKYTG